MSAPDTNTEKQKDAHKAPLRLGIVLPIVFALGLAVVVFVAMFLRGDDPEGADAVVDGRSGEVTEVPATE